MIPQFFIVLLMLVPALLQADLTKAMAEQDLEKRSRLALENARSAYDEMHEAYKANEMDKVAASAKEIEESVKLASESLKATGKNPRKNPKYFKSAEITTRALLRRVENFQREMSFDDRAILESARKKLLEVHDELLIGLMEGQKK